MHIMHEMNRSPDDLASARSPPAVEHTGLEAAAGILVGLLLGVCMWGALLLLVLPLFF